MYAAGRNYIYVYLLLIMNGFCCDFAKLGFKTVSFYNVRNTQYTLYKIFIKSRLQKNHINYYDNH